MSPGGPQNQNVISYGQALGASLGCDPYTGCPATTQEPMSGQSLQNWLNPIASSASIATNPGTYAPSSGAPVSAPASTACGSSDYWCQMQAWYAGKLANPTFGPSTDASGNIVSGGTPITVGGQTAVAGATPGFVGASIVGRIAAFLLGLIGIAGAVYLFKE